MHFYRGISEGTFFGSGLRAENGSTRLSRRCTCGNTDPEDTAGSLEPRATAVQYLCNYWNSLCKLNLNRGAEDIEGKKVNVHTITARAGPKGVGKGHTVTTPYSQDS